MIWLMLVPMMAIVFFLGYFAGAVMTRLGGDSLDGAVRVAARGKNFPASHSPFARIPRHR
jgi:hypothetical protein